MASAHYNLGLQRFLDALIDMPTDTIRVRLVRVSAYVFSQAHEFASSLPAAIATDVTLGTKTITSGEFDAADAVFAAVPSGAAIDALVIFKFVTNDADSPLIAYIDGFSVTPNGGDITIQWQNSSPRIFKL